ncbi:MAG: serine/threonine-protein kinase [Planctomycetes bacterium]|nr:serine/threonine-protein kinase [Planctomycetota bacterium]
MPLAAGRKLSFYEILAPLGAGAMGEVYRARDTRLGREVAIKVLPEHFAEDEERLKRFEREAKTLASLNHPNVAQIYGVDQVGDTCFLVLELVPGESLDERLKRGPLPLDEALDVCRQIAEGLEAAHEAGMIHRDLKPANVRITPEGKVKVLDFGLAKPAIEGRSGSSADSVLSTEMGRLLGTPTYMAPEQARGKAIDKRVDIWAFGCVLYECLTAKRLFDGETLTDVLTTVLHEELDLATLPAGVPARVRELLVRCLAKDPRHRLRDIGDARLVLERSGVLEERLESGVRSSVLGHALPWSVCALLTLLLILVSLQAFGLLELWSPAVAPASTQGALHVSLSLPAGDEVGNLAELPLAISPDGTQVVYVGMRSNKVQLYLRPLALAEPTPIAGTEGAKSPFFSPDSRWIGFFAQGKLKKVTVGGTALQVLADAPSARGGCWGPDDTLYFAPTNVSGLWRVPALGGPATELTRLERGSSEISHRWPHVLPDGKTLLFSIWTGPGPDEQHIVRQSLAAGGERHVLVPGGDAARFLSPGYLLYGRLDGLFAVPWVPSQIDLEGAVPLAMPELPREDGEGVSACVLSTGGTLAYLPGGPARRAQRLVWVDRTGVAVPLPLPERDYRSVVISPDGRQVIVQIEEGMVGLWLYDFARQTMTPFATSGGSSQAPVWTPDGKRVIYRGTRAGFRNLFWKSADGTGEEERLTTKADVVQTPTSVSPDGRWLVFDEGGGAQADTEMWMVPLDGERSPNGSGRTEPVEGHTPLLLVQGTDGQVAPDGKWIAYQSLVSGRDEIYVQPFPGPGPRQPISTGGAQSPLWSRDGSELFFTTLDELLAVDITTTPTFSAGAPHVVFEGRYRDSDNGNTPYDVSADGRRFLRVQQVQPDRAVTHIDVVLNWLAEVEQAAAGK